MADFSCYVSILNDTPYALTLTKSDDTWGYWKVSPPTTISAFGGSGSFQLADKAGPAGSGGGVEYTVQAPGSGTFAIKFTDPVEGDNACSISNPDSSLFGVNFYATCETVFGNNSCPRDGHPLTMVFFIRKFG
jgi:hypothetical protein